MVADFYSEGAACLDASVSIWAYRFTADGASCARSGSALAENSPVGKGPLYRSQSVKCCNGSRLSSSSKMRDPSPLLMPVPPPWRNRAGQRSRLEVKGGYLKVAYRLQGKIFCGGTNPNNGPCAQRIVSHRTWALKEAASNSSCGTRIWTVPLFCHEKTAGCLCSVWGCSFWPRDMPRYRSFQ